MKARHFPLLVLSCSQMFPLAQALESEAIDLRFELRANYRHSADEVFPLNFPPGAALETVDPGSHAEFSNFTTFFRAQLSSNWLLSAKIDMIDLYERNPTSGDKKIDIDTLFLRYGTKHGQGLLPEKVTFYGQVGKFGKFERQEDRHLESYGLVSTSFNRLEDSGIELGMDLASGFYAKVSYTTGNPLFFRDPNALAGDNGIVDNGTIDPDPKYNSGIVMLYDAEVEGFDLNKNPEVGGGLGYRWLSDSGTSRVNVLLHYNERDMADTVELEGTFYGGDLDFLAINPDELPPGTIPSTVGLDFDGRKKSEAGATVWYYQDNFALFMQYVSQDVATLKRDGWEVEMSYAFLDVMGLARITPAFRYSQLAMDFSGPSLYPSPSVWWDRDKIDIGVNFDVNEYVRLTVEQSFDRFERDSGEKDSNNETLLTLRLRYDVL